MLILKKYYIIITGIIIFLIYLTTIAPTIIESDSGELATVQYTLGIAHPTGYPLFTIVGYLFSKIPLSASPAYELNLLSAFWTTLAAVVFMFISKMLLENLSKFNSSFKLVEKSRLKNKLIISCLSDTRKIIVIIAGGFMLAFSRTFWYQSTSVEVYSLNLFLVNLSILFLLKAYFNEDDNSFISKNWIIAGIFFSLALANHRSVVYILPAAMYIFFLKEKISLVSLKKFGILTLLILLITSGIYLYIPIRASQMPLMNWENASTFENFKNLFLGKYYRQFMTSDAKDFSKQLNYFFSTVILGFSFKEQKTNEFAFSLLLSFVGIIVSFFSYKRYLIIFSLITFTTVLLSCFYNIPDIENYFLSAYVSIVFYAIIGICFLFSLLPSKYFNILIAVFVSLCILSQIIYNYNKNNLSNKYWTSDITKSVLYSVENRSVIFTYVDHIFSAYYLQNVEGIRKDVTIVSQRLFEYKWYCEQLKVLHPDIIRENNGRYVIDSKNKNLYINPEISRLISKKVFVLPPGAKIVPGMFLYKVVYTDEYVPVNFMNYNIRYSPEINSDELLVRKDILKVLTDRYYYEIKYKRFDRANQLHRKIIEWYPDLNLKM